MGLHQLRTLDQSDFYAWVKRSGYTDEHDFWKRLSGIEGSRTDCMVSYLTSLGYVGNPSDMFRQFLKDQVGLISGTHEGTMFDMANELFDGTFAIASTPSTGVVFIDFVPFGGLTVGGAYQ